jgi:hypothetical protein
MSKKFLLGVILASLAVAACGNPVSPDQARPPASTPSYDGGNMMGGGS